jgi:hypothetical protein
MYRKLIFIIIVLFSVLLLNQWNILKNIKMENFCPCGTDLTSNVTIKEGFNSEGCVETFQGGFTNENIK